MPWAAPVTMAFLFFSLMEFLSFYSMDSVQPGLGLAPGDDAAAGIYRLDLAGGV